MARFLKLICFFLIFNTQAHAQTDSMAVIEAGSFIPLYGTGSKVQINKFLIDVYPVTNLEYLEFVKQNPEWKKSRVIDLFADNTYLESWPTDEDYGKDKLPNAPVTNISWFAAKKYCECLGKRLPTVDEWEYVAMADETKPDARKEESYNKFILSWYETPRSFEKPIGETYKNYWGVYDLHGLVWEWTSDFNSVIVVEDQEGDTGENNLFCDIGQVTTSDLMNYAAFMRYALRGSLKGNYTLKNLGFRCAKDINNEIDSNSSI